MVLVPVIKQLTHAKLQKSRGEVKFNDDEKRAFIAMSEHKALNIYLK